MKTTADTTLHGPEMGCLPLRPPAKQECLAFSPLFNTVPVVLVKAVTPGKEQQKNDIRIGKALSKDNQRFCRQWDPRCCASRGIHPKDKGFLRVVRHEITHKANCTSVHYGHSKN